MSPKTSGVILLCDFLNSPTAVSDRRFFYNGVYMKLRFYVFLYFNSISAAYCADGATILKNFIETAPSAASIGLFAEGGADILSGVAERNADASAQRVRDAEVVTFKCRISGVAGETNYNDTGAVPGLSEDFIADKIEYLSLAQSLKSDKDALGMPPGIESYEIIADTTGLYDYSSPVEFVHVFDGANDADEKIARGLDFVQAGIEAAVVANIGQVLSNSKGATKDQPVNNVSMVDKSGSSPVLVNNTGASSTVQSINNAAKEVRSDDVTEQCPAKYCKGGSEYTDDETCEAWKLCGCQEGSSPDDVCATERGQELCECK